MGNFTIAINCSYLVRKDNQTFNLIETFINKENQPQNHVPYYSSENWSAKLSTKSTPESCTLLF
jgi:hypothetical protein